MSTQQPSRTSFIALAAALVVAIVAVAYLVVRLDGAEDDAASDRERLTSLSAEKAAGAAALKAARTVLVDMTSYSFKTVADDFDWLDRIADDELRERMTKNVESLTRIIKTGKARAEGEVVDAASRVVDPAQVEILAFVDQVIRDGEHDGYKVEEQRVSMTMVLQDGEWLVDRLDLQSGDNAS